MAEGGDVLGGPRGSADAARARRPTALVVEDAELVRSLLGRILVGAGYTVVEAADGEGALAARARYDHPIDLLVTDVGLPGISGWDLAERLHGELPGLKTVVISGAVGEPSRTPGPGAAFLRKPFTPATLVQCVRRLRATGD
jgi:CheY-like chemotaxis protein